MKKKLFITLFFLFGLVAFIYEGIIHRRFVRRIPLPKKGEEI